MSRRRHRSRRQNGGPPRKSKAARPLIVRLLVFLVKILIVVMLSPFVLVFSMFMGLVLPNGAGAHVVSEMFSRLFDRLFGPNAQEFIFTGKRRRGFFD